MRRHFHQQHERAEDDDHTSNSQTIYSATSSGPSPPSNALSEGHQGIAELLQKNGAVVNAGGRRDNAPHASASMRTGRGLELAAEALGSQAYHSMTTPDSQYDYFLGPMLSRDDGYKREQLPSIREVLGGMSLPLPLSLSHISIFRYIVSP